MMPEFRGLFETMHLNILILNIGSQRIKGNTSQHLLSMPYRLIKIEHFLFLLRLLRVSSKLVQIDGGIVLVYFLNAVVAEGPEHRNFLLVFGSWLFLSFLRLLCFQVNVF